MNYKSLLGLSLSALEQNCCGLLDDDNSKLDSLSEKNYHNPQNNWRVRPVNMRELFWPAFIIKHSLLLSCEFCCKNEKLFSIKISTRNDRFKDIWFQIDHLDRLIFFYSLPLNSKSYIVTYVKSLYS